MTPVTDRWWFVAIAVLLVAGLVGAFIPGYRPVAFVLFTLALLAYAFVARRRSKGRG